MAKSPTQCRASGRRMLDRGTSSTSRSVARTHRGRTRPFAHRLGRRRCSMSRPSACRCCAAASEFEVSVKHVHLVGEDFQQRGPAGAVHAEDVIKDRGHQEYFALHWPLARSFGRATPSFLSFSGEPPYQCLVGSLRSDMPGSHPLCSCRQAMRCLPLLRVRERLNVRATSRLVSGWGNRCRSSRHRRTPRVRLVDSPLGLEGSERQRLSNCSDTEYRVDD